MIEEVIKKLEKQHRVPRNYDIIEKGALALELKDRVSLRDKLTASIEEEITQLEATFNEAKKLIGK